DSIRQNLYLTQTDVSCSRSQRRLSQMKRFRMFAATSLLFAVAFALQAQSTNNTTTAQDVKNATKNAAITAGNYTKEQLQELNKKSEAEFHALGKKLD